MKPIIPFDPTSANNDTGDIDTKGSSIGEQLLLYNTSPNALLLTFADTTQDTLPPLWVKSWIVKTVPMQKVHYSTIFVLNMTSQPLLINHVTQAIANQVYGTLYESTEVRPAIDQAIPYVFTVGNNGGLSNVSATTLVNDGNATLTQFIESTVVGKGFSSVSVTNDGKIFIKDINGNIIFMVDYAQTNIIQLARVGQTVEILGRLLVDSGLIGVSAIGDTIDASTSELHALTKGGDFVVLQNPGAGAVETFRINNIGQMSHSLANNPNINGLTGFMRIFQPFKGVDYKVLKVKFSNFKGNGQQDLALLTAFAGRSEIHTFGLPSNGIQFLLAGVAQTMDVLTTLAPASPGGTTTSETTLFANSIAQLRTGFDTIRVLTGDVNTTSALMNIVGGD